MSSVPHSWLRDSARPMSRGTKKRGFRPSLLSLEDRVVPTNIGGAAYYAVATQAGPVTQVKVYNAASGALVDTLTPFGTNYKLGANVAVGDVNGDGFQDIVVGSGRGADPLVIVYSGAPADGMFPGGTPRILKSFYPYFNSFHPNSAGKIVTGGVNVAVGDVNGDGFDDVIAAVGGDGSPQVRVFSGAALGSVSPTDPTSSSGVLFNFFAGFDLKFAGGVRVAAGDIGGDRTTAEIIVTAGPGGSAHTIVYASPVSTDPKLPKGEMTMLSQFFAFPTDYTGGSYVAVGALTNNRDSQGVLYGDIIVSKGSGAPEVRVYRLLDVFPGTSGVSADTYVFTADLTDKTITPNVDFTANFGSGFKGGATVAVFHAGPLSATSSEFDAVNLLVGAGPGGTGVAYTYNNDSLSDGQQVASLPVSSSPPNVVAFPTVSTGVTVG